MAIKSAQRAIEILELFEKIRRPARVSEVADLLSYPQSSTTFLLQSLRELGYITYNTQDRTFSPSLRVALIGSWLQFGEVGREQILQILTSIRERSGEATLLSTRNGVYAQYIYTLDPAGPMGMHFKPGTLRPLHLTAPGVVLMGDCDDAEISRIVRRQNVDAEPRHLQTPQDVIASVRLAREAGYACIVGKLNPKIGSVAMKLPFEDIFSKSLVVSVSGSAKRIRSRAGELIEILRSEIQRASRRQPL